MNNTFFTCGFKEDSEYTGLYTHPKLPFYVSEERGFLTVNVNLEYPISSGRIPATIENLQNLIKAFNP